MRLDRPPGDAPDDRDLQYRLQKIDEAIEAEQAAQAAQRIELGQVGLQLVRRPQEAVLDEVARGAGHHAGHQHQDEDGRPRVDRQVGHGDRPAVLQRHGVRVLQEGQQPQGEVPGHPAAGDGDRARGAGQGRP